jgi:oxygen-dependent protoporphyrinogen oxidase
VRVAVVGGGITGLSAAYELARGPGEHIGAPVEVVLVEAEPRFGGKIRTSSVAGLPVDEAADAFLARVPDAVDLCRELGLGDQLVSPAAGQAYLYSRGALRPFPPGVVLGVPTDLDALRASGALSDQGVARAADDLTMGPDPARFAITDPPDESVGAVVRRRVGDEVFERLVAPLLSGVHAGDADRLSVAAGAPQFAAALREHPSLIEGLRAQRAAASADSGGGEAPVFYGLASGSQTLTDALVTALDRAGADLRSGTTVEQLDATTTGYRLSLHRGEAIDVDAVVLTTPLPATAALVATLDGTTRRDVADEMKAVDYAEVALVTCSVAIDGVDRDLDGSGFLVAQPEGLLLTACSWASTKWAHLAQPGHAILRASVGRADDRRGAALTDDELVAAVLADLATTMELHAPPDEVRVSRWPAALPQFTVGHLDRARTWEPRLSEASPHLAIAGAGVLGLGVPACVGQGRAAARRVLSALSAPDGAPA